jgi:hypothetical protein
MPNLTGFGNLSGFYEVIFLNVYRQIEKWWVKANAGRIPIFRVL